jgi:hypothetical protein
MQVPAEDLDRYRKPVLVRLERWVALRVFLAGSVVAWGFVFRDFHYLQDRVPIEENGIGYMVRSAEHELWWAPVLGVAAGVMLLLPTRRVPTRASRILSVAVAAALVVAGGSLIGWAAPIQSYREGALFDPASTANVAVTAYVFVLPGALALASAAVVAAHTGVCSTARAKTVVTWAVVPVVAAIPVGVGLAQWINGARPVAMGYLILLAMMLVPMVLLVGWWRNPVFGTLRLVVGGLMLAGAAGLLLLGLVSGVACLFASSSLNDYLCPASLATLAFGQGAFLYGWVLTVRHVNRVRPLDQ